MCAKGQNIVVYMYTLYSYHHSFFFMICDILIVRKSSYKYTCIVIEVFDSQVTEISSTLNMCFDFASWTLIVSTTHVYNPLHSIHFINGKTCILYFSINNDVVSKTVDGKYHQIQCDS